MIVKQIWITMTGLSLLLASNGCYNDSEEYLYPGSSASVDCTSIQSTFTADVRPLISSQCAISGCHNAASASGGVVLETYAQINARADRIMQRAVVEKSMPPSGPLLPSESAKISCWIQSGALNN